jgi:group I intron endonuclease
MTCGVYGILHVDTGKWYVGYSKNIESRWWRHVRDANKQPRIAIQFAIRKYGKEAFKFCILEECEPPSLVKVEKKWIDIKNSFTKGFNSVNCGISPVLLTNEVRLKIGNGMRGKKHTVETKEKIAKSLAGRKVPPTEKRLEYYKRIKGIKRSPEVCAAISKSKLGKKRKPLSEEHKELLRQRNLDFYRRIKDVS